MHKKVISIGKIIISNPLFGGSAVMIFGSNIANFLAFCYHFIFGRMFGPSEYGDLSAIISLLGLIMAVYSFLNLVIVKLVASSDKKGIEHVYTWFTKKAIVLGVLVAGLLVIVSPLISQFLHINISLSILIGPIFLLSLLLFVYKAFLHGLLRFKQMVLVTNSEMFLRLFLGIIFVFLGMQVFGALLGILLGTLTSWLLTKHYLRDLKLKKGVDKIQFNKNKLISATIPIFLATLASHSFYTTDVLLVKHYFNSVDAGLYAALSNLGKIIFFGTAPVVSVMFPMITKRFAERKDYQKIFLLSLMMVGILSSIALIIYMVFPQLPIRILYGEKYLMAAKDLFWFGLFITIFSLNSLFVSYFLARDKNKVVYFSVIAAICQIVGIVLFHQTILMVIQVSIITSALMLTGLLLYFGHEIKGSKKIF